MTKTVGVVLSGCGYLDGSEISEAVLTLLALDRNPASLKVRCLAPSMEQTRVNDHLSGNTLDQTRNVLVESARIARGEVEDIGEVDPSEFHGVLLPGGFGAALNLSNFAERGGVGEINPHVEKFLKEFRQDDKPLGAICISPAIVALLLGRKGVRLTIGEDEDTAAQLKKTGACHEYCPVDSVVIDEKHKIVSTPAYMYGSARLSHIAMGIDKCVDQVISWL